jgi:hypothetical protein
VAPPLVQQGHVAAWVGVGAPGEGPHGSDEWLQVGLNRLAGNASELYYELAQPWGIRYAALETNVPVGRRYRVEVLEMAGRRSVWQVWVNGRPASRPIWLPASHGALTPMAIAENWDGGAAVCNRYAYAFARVAVAGNPGGSWRPLRVHDARVMADPGYRVVPMTRGGFLAVSSTSPISGAHVPRDRTVEAKPSRDGPAAPPHRYRAGADGRP